MIFPHMLHHLKIITSKEVMKFCVAKSPFVNITCAVRVCKPSYGSDVPGLNAGHGRAVHPIMYPPYSGWSMGWVPEETLGNQAVDRTCPVSRSNRLLPTTDSRRRETEMSTEASCSYSVCHKLYHSFNSNTMMSLGHRKFKQWPAANLPAKSYLCERVHFHLDKKKV